MPEAPEIEILKKELKSEIVGQRISKIFVGPPNLFLPSISLFKEYLPGKKIIDIDRYGKVLILSINDKYNIGIHFGIDGVLLYIDKEMKKNYEFFMELENNKALLFKGLKYGKITLFEDKKIYKELGPDVLDKDLFTELYLKDVIKGKNRAIKSLLMDQKIVSGLGNTYTDEILYKAKVYPKRKAKTLTDREISDLFISIKEIIDKAISLGGNSEDGFTDIYGKKGNVQEELIVVHHREGNPCPICNAKIKKIKINGRDTYFCPTCQI